MSCLCESVYMKNTDRSNTDACGCSRESGWSNCLVGVGLEWTKVTHVTVWRAWAEAVSSAKRLSQKCQYSQKLKGINPPSPEARWPWLLWMKGCSGREVAASTMRSYLPGQTPLQSNQHVMRKLRPHGKVTLTSTALTAPANGCMSKQVSLEPS